MTQQLNFLIPEIHNLLYQHFGPLNWWPADSPYEVAVGAILTQNTAWTNVEYAIGNLKAAGGLSPERIASTPAEVLEGLIKPSGFFRQKATRLKEFSEHIVDHWQGDIRLLCTGPLDEVRTRLLHLKGIGPETADSILLYAANRKSFVVDAYTKRIFLRVGILQGNEAYEDIRTLFMQHLPEDATLYNEYHAEIVNLAKSYCRSKPLCCRCPIRKLCRHAQG